MKKKSAIVISISACAVAFLTAGVVLFVHAHSRAVLESCVCNLSFIEGCKQQWALEHNASTNTSVTWKELYDYVKRPDWPPPCPGGGLYTPGRIGELPSCSISAHTIYFRELR